MILRIIVIYLAVGFILNLAFIIWEKATHQEQRPETYLEVLVMALMFLVGVPFWPVVWWVRIQDWRGKREE